MAIVRDKLWIFGARAHQDDIYLYNSPETTKNLPNSRITPAEAALMLDCSCNEQKGCYLQSQVLLRIPLTRTDIWRAFAE